VVLSEYSSPAVKKAASRLAKTARSAMRDDSDYISAVTASTGDRRRVRLRFEQAQVMTRSVLGDK